MIIRSKAPLRLGFAGGGSDVSPYSDLYGGLILNATINLYAYCTIEETDDDAVSLTATDLGVSVSYPLARELPVDGSLDLHKGVFNRVVRDFGITPRPCRIYTYSDAPAGSGLGSSSTMVVCVLKAFVEWYNLPMGDYEIARLAYRIEREDLALSGGKQDQYAAAFGGFNFMEFLTDGNVIVNPLRVKRWIVDELESSIVLYYTGASRSSAAIIEEQKRNTSTGNGQAIEAMHRIRQSAIDMKRVLLEGNMEGFARILGQAWEDKKKMAAAISNPMIQEVFDIAFAAGAKAGKVSGAGGGGFIIFMTDPARRRLVINALESLPGKVVGFQFSEGGTHGWKIYE
ncbi:MAG: dehydrogenase [Bacteroidaceae bacterium]|nr:dehydrogenase [Bacteroidaceae bacterium]